jgi:hypothetical protein
LDSIFVNKEQALQITVLLKFLCQIYPISQSILPIVFLGTLDYRIYNELGKGINSPEILKIVIRKYVI